MCREPGLCGVISMQGFQSGLDGWLRAGAGDWLGREASAALVAAELASFLIAQGMLDVRGKIQPGSRSPRPPGALPGKPEGAER